MCTHFLNWIIRNILKKRMLGFAKIFSFTNHASPAPGIFDLEGRYVRLRYQNISLLFMTSSTLVLVCHTQLIRMIFTALNFF